MVACRAPPEPVKIDCATELQYSGGLGYGAIVGLHGKGIIVLGSLTAPAKGIANPCGLYCPVSGFVDRRRLAGSPLLRRDVVEAGVEMFRVVPVHEFGIPLPSLLEGREESGIVDRVFQRLVPGFDECVVVAAARA